MFRKLLSVAAAYIAVCAIVVAVSGHGSQATTSLYNLTIRVVDGVNKVLNGTASATTASYNTTVLLVDSTGTPMTGTESATTASPNLVARVVDANNKVLNSLGGGGTATPTPAAVATATSSLSNSVTITGTTAGDVIYCHVCGNNGTSMIANTGWTNLASGAFGGGPPFHLVLTHVVVPGDTSSYTPVSGTNTFNSMACVELAHAYPSADTISDWSTAKNTVSSATVTTNNATSTLANDVGIWLALAQSSSDISAAPSGYTTLAHIAATGSFQGCAIAFNPNVGAAGTITTGNATGSNAAGTYSTQTALVRTYVNNY